MSLHLQVDDIVGSTSGSGSIRGSGTLRSDTSADSWRGSGMVCTSSAQLAPINEDMPTSVVERIGEVTS